MAPHILIVDADRSAAEVTSALIRRIAPDATPRYASTPYYGWIVAQCAVPDVLVIDPSAYHPASALLIQLCKEAWPPMQIIVLTSARTGRQLMEADVYMDKALAAPALVQTLRTVLETITNDASPAPLQVVECAPAASTKDETAWIGVR